MTSEMAFLNGGNQTIHNNYNLKPPQTHSNINNENSFSQSSSSSASPSSSNNSSLNNSNTNNNDLITKQQDLSLYDPNIKYPLENSWSFWFYKGEKTKTWKENVKFITTVDYVEDFWA